MKEKGSFRIAVTAALRIMGSFSPSVLPVPLDNGHGLTSRDQNNINDTKCPNVGMLYPSIIRLGRVNL